MKHRSILAALLVFAPLAHAQPLPPPAPDGGAQFGEVLVARTLTLNPHVGEKATYLGANVAALLPALADQLKLPTGVGLVVESVDPQSPADLAGIKPHDVLHKLADQLLVNPAQLSALIRAAKPDEAVGLQAIRQGAPITLTAKLVAKETPTTFLVFSNANDEQAITFQPAGVRAMAAKRMILQDMNGQQTTEWADADHIVSITRENNATLRAAVRDAKTGKTLFEGPANTPEQRKAIAPDLLKKIEQAEQVPQPNVAPFRVWLDQDAAPGKVAARGRVLAWSNADLLFIVRAMGPANQPTPTYLLALSKKDGKTLFDGPVMTDEQKQSLPPEIAEPFKSLLAHPETAKEFGAK